jgi:hypothetical protein
MAMIVRAYPIVADGEEVKQFAAALRAQPQETTAFYTRFGVTHESWHLQDTAAGLQLISVTIVDDPGVQVLRYANASENFETWFKQQVRRLSGVDPNRQPLGPESTQVFEWSRSSADDSGSARSVG